MLKHEYFQELCAAASIGQASAEELVELEQHASECAECRHAYAEHLQLAAHEYAAAGREPHLSLEEATACLNSPLFEQRFFDLARREGITFSAEADGDIRKKLSPAAIPLIHRQWWRFAGAAIAVVLLMGIVTPIAYYFSKGAYHRTLAGDTQSDLRAAALERRIAELARNNAALTLQISALTSRTDSLKIQLQQTADQLNTDGASLQAAAQQRKKLASDRDALEAQLRQIESQLSVSQAEFASAQQEVAKMRGTTAEATASLVAAQMKINDLSEELKTKSAALDQERQLLALGHDVSDLMGARNLHIVDVVDTDPRGRTRPSFGRIFFTEGKSLVFYAYDLNEARIEKADYQYRVWAKKEGGNRKVKSLGIFYADDKSQRRWVYKCNDPKMLSEIDSVFVTLEPVGAEPAHPRGPNLMYAYLRGQPNHP